MAGSTRKPLGRRVWNWLRLPGDDLWAGEAEGLDWVRRKILGGLRILHLVWTGYRDDACKLHASALTYYTLMAIVPLLALALSLIRVFGGEAIAHDRIRAEIDRFGRQLASGAVSQSDPDGRLVAEFVAQLNRYGDVLFEQVARISFGTLGGIGLVVLFWMAISMLGQVEHSFNQVWNAPPRTLWRKCSDYLTLIILVPFLAIAATTIPVATLVTTQLNGWVAQAGLAVFFKQATPLFFSVLLFVTIFKFIPNTQVRLKPAIIGGVVTALACLIWLRICAGLQVGVIKYSKLYGGFAVLPILLAWVYTSWQIVLFGAELSFAIQHAETYGREQSARTASMRARWQLALVLVADMARAMRDGLPPIRVAEYARRHRLSVRLINDVLEDLQAAGLVGATAGEIEAHVLLRDPSTLSAAAVVAAILDRGTPPGPLGLNPLDPEIRDFAQRAESAWRASLDTPVARLITSSCTPTETR